VKENREGMEIDRTEHKAATLQVLMFMSVLCCVWRHTPRGSTGGTVLSMAWQRGASGCPGTCGECGPRTVIKSSQKYK
jgi:hypothetical protein